MPQRHFTLWRALLDPSPHVRKRNGQRRQRPQCGLRTDASSTGDPYGTPGAVIASANGIRLREFS